MKINGPAGVESMSGRLVQVEHYAGQTQTINQHLRGEKINVQGNSLFERKLQSCSVITLNMFSVLTKIIVNPARIKQA